jgi:alpha/beta superfamily hydrolase
LSQLGLQEERVWIPHGEVMLEGMVSLGRAFAGVVCHPHPGYGGNMENNVVRAACLGLSAAGGSVLRFNFRGRNPGCEPTEQGDLELEEAKAALNFLRTRTGCDPSWLVLVGYSFGAWVGIRALRAMEPILGWVAVAPPLGIWDFSFTKGISGNKLLIAGTKDNFCPLSLLEELFESLEEPKELRIIEGADHFFWGFESRLTDIVKGAVSSWTKGLSD